MAKKKTEVAVCIQDRNRKVLYQNAACVELCGKRKRAVCRDGCMELRREASAKAATENRPELLRKRAIRDRYFDVIFLNAADYLATVLQPLKELPMRERVAELETLGLTRRELEVATMALKGHTNREIASALSISEATLKTHVNRINKKISSSGRTRFAGLRLRS